MESVVLTVIALFALIVWKFVFAGLHRRLLGEIPVRHQEYDGVLERRLHIFEQPLVRAIAGNGGDMGSYRINLIYAESPAETYLRRIAALTGAAQMSDGYVLNVGTTRFHVRDRYVRRLRDVGDAKCAYEETCFYPAFQVMPKAEQIAAVLLQLRNNPALFDKWALQKEITFKADGHVYAHVR